MTGHKPLTLKTEKVLIGSFEGLALVGIEEEVVGTLSLGKDVVDDGIDDSVLLWGAKHVESGRETSLFCCPSPRTSLSSEH